MGYKTGGVPGRRKTRPTGRTPKLQPAAKMWLEAYLSGAPRPAKEIEQVGKNRGFGLVTLKRCKAELGFTSFRRGHEWFWKDPSVPEATQNPERTIQQVVQDTIKEELRVAQLVAPVALKESTVPVVPREPEPIKPRFGDILTREYIPPPPPMSICDAPNPDEMIAKATKDQLERVKLELYEGAIAAHNRGKTEEVDRLWALANRVREQLGEKPRPEKYKPGYKANAEGTF